MNRQVSTETIKDFLASSESVSPEQILEWMRSEEIQVQAGIVVILSDCYDRISPPLDPQTEFEFCIAYYKRCLLEDPPEGEFTANRTVEGDALQKWFKALWANGRVNKELLARLRKMLTEVYKGGDDATKYAVETAVLEHLCEDPEIVHYFSNWANDPSLREAYSRAKEWGSAAGSRDQLL